MAEIVDEVFRNNFGFGEDEPTFSSDPEDDRVYFQPTGEPFLEALETLTGADDDRVTGLLALIVRR